MATPTAHLVSKVSSADVAIWSVQHVLRVGAVLLQLVLAAMVIQAFQLENRTFFNIFVLAAIAFPVNALLPLAYRLHFFATVSLAGIFLVFGPVDGVMLIAAGVCLIAACHTPVAFSFRIVLVLTLGGAFALARAGMAPSPISTAVWPILGSMFMFRLALYLHALRYDAARPTLAQTLSYFFLLPNVCYPLFPVVDYTTFTRTHYDADAGEIYERGVKWIVRGLVHLLLYRLVYLHFSIEVTQVQSLGDLLQSLLSVFFLYLRISGQFHLIVGMLHLFGFHLPETHRLYFLASSITDYWRRINIYWKDFMMKLVYYPGFFRLRRRFGDRAALIQATMLVFLATWALHSYQWFWLRSEFPITPQDIAFWGLLGGLVVANSLREMKRGRTRRSLAPARRTWNASRAAHTLGTFTLLCVLWSLWSADSLIDWLWLWPAALQVGPGDILFLAMLLLSGMAVFGVNWDAPVAEKKGGTPFYRRPMVQTVATLMLLLLLSNSRVQALAGPRGNALIASLQSTSLNRRDADLMRQGYYENLDDRGRLSMQLWQTVEGRPADWGVLSQTPAWRRTGDFLMGDLQPETQVVLARKQVTINRWGMRDRDYTLEKPAGARRLAILGPSFVMGIGVGDDETWDGFLEARLNEAAPEGTVYEVLNFGTGAYSLLQQMYMLDQRVFQFSPDVVIITDSPRADAPVVAHLTDALFAGVPIPYPELRQLIRQAGIDTVSATGHPVPTRPLRRLAAAGGVQVRIPWRETSLRLHAAADTIMTWSLRHMAEQIRNHGATPVFLSLGQVADTTQSDLPHVKSAHRAGFIVIDALDLYDGQERERMRAAPWDDHPNALATRMIADRLYSEFREREREIGLGLVARPAHGATQPEGE